MANLDHTEPDDTEPDRPDSIDSTDGSDGGVKPAGDQPTANVRPSSGPSLRDQLGSGAWKPARVSGDDLARLVAARRHKSDPSELSDPLDTQRTGRDVARYHRFGGGVIAVVLVTVLLVLATTTGVSHSNDQERRKSNVARIAALEHSLMQARRRADVTGGSEALSGLVEEVTNAADAVAAGQQRYAELAYAANPNASATGKAGYESRGDGVPSRSVLAMVQQRRVLARYWSEDSLVVGAEKAYVFDTVDPFGPGQIDPRWPWYLGHDGPRAADPATYEWTRLSVALATESSDDTGRTPRQVQVVWVCEETKTGVVLAWARADYDADTSRFSSLRLAASSHTTRPRAPSTAPDHSSQHGEQNRKQDGKQDREEDTR